MEVDESVEKRSPVVQYVDVGGRVLGDAGEEGRGIHRVVGVSGPADDGILPFTAGVKRELPGRPGDAQGLDDVIAGVERHARVIPVRRMPALDSGDAAAAVVPPSAVEHDDPRVVALAEGRQEAEGVAEDGAVRRFVEQTPHRHAGVVAVAEHHAQHRFVIALGELRRIGHAPRGVRLLVDHQADLVAEVQLVSFGDAGNETDRVEPHRLGVDQVAAEEIGVVRQFQADRAAVAGVRAAEVDPPAVEPEGPLLETEIAKTAAHTLLVEQP